MTQKSAWDSGPLPTNVRLGFNSRITGSAAFSRFLSQRDDALILGTHCCALDTGFAIGTHGKVRIGNYCYLDACTLLAEHEIQIGNYVMIGWGTTISDTDFHPLEPAERICDAIALSPLSKDRARPKIAAYSVTIRDAVFIGPACTILKGVMIGEGVFIEPGSVVTRDVPAHAHVRGNPATIVQGERS